MFIKLKKQSKYIPLIQLRENKNMMSNNDMLLEAAHAFDEQYIWAKKCAEIIYKCIKENKNHASITFEKTKDKSIKGVEIEINTNNILNTNANLSNLTSEGFLKINVNLRNDILSKSKQFVINEIWDAIVHELGHGNIYWKRYKNNQDINDLPDEYIAWQKVLKDETIMPNDSVYLFCYALYSTYYHEIQAFVSQTYSDLIKNLKKSYGSIENISKEQFWKALTKTNTYQTYKSNLYIADYLLDSIDGRQKLIQKLNDFNINYNEEQIIGKCKEIKEKSNDALKCSYNNAYQWFYKSFKK